MPTPDDNPHEYDDRHLHDQHPHDQHPHDRHPHDQLPHDPHDPRRESERQDNLVLLALGEPVTAEFEAHRIACDRCRYDLDAFRHTVALGREMSAHREDLDAEPPAAVWSAISAQMGASSATPPGRDELGPDTADASATGHDAATSPAPGARSPALSSPALSSPAPRPLVRRPAGPGSGAHHARHRVRSRMRLVAAAAALIVVGVAGGYVAGHSAGAQQRHVASNARLASVPGGPAQVTGAASVRGSSDGRQVSVTTTGLPLRNGFYEVWLYDPNRGSGGDMVAIGALGDRGRGTFTLPAGIDIRDYHIVNVSAQDYGGGVRIVHAQSVLQGTLTQ